MDNKYQLAPTSTTTIKPQQHSLRPVTYPQSETGQSFKQEAIQPQHKPPTPSPKVTVSLPKHAASKLLELVQRRDISLLRLGIISVQFENDQIIPLTINASNAAATTTNNDTITSNSSTIASISTTCLTQQEQPKSVDHTELNELPSSAEDRNDFIVENCLKLSKATVTQEALPSEGEKQPELTETITDEANQALNNAEREQTEFKQPDNLDTHLETSTVESTPTTEVTPSNGTETNGATISTSQNAFVKMSLDTEVDREGSTIGAGADVQKVDCNTNTDLPAVYDDNDDRKDEDEVVREVENQHDSFNIHQLSQLEFADPVDIDMYDTDNLLFPDYTLNLS